MPNARWPCCASRSESAFSPLSVTFSLRRTDSSPPGRSCGQHRAASQVVRNGQQREVQGVLLEVLIAASRQRSARLPVGKHMLDLRPHFRPAVVERGLSGREFAATRVEAYPGRDPGIAQAAAPRRVAVGRIGLYRIGGRTLQQFIHRHGIVHRSARGLDGAHDLAAVVHRDMRLESMRDRTPVLDCPAGLGVAARPAPLGGAWRADSTMVASTRVPRLTLTPAASIFARTAANSGSASPAFSERLRKRTSTVSSGTASLRGRARESDGRIGGRRIALRIRDRTGCTTARAAAS